MAGLEKPWPIARTVYMEYAEHSADQMRSPRDNPDVFIQWKGTDVCFDFWCDCGSGGHYDGYFAYQIECGACGQVWEMPSTIIPVKAIGRETAEPVVVGPEE